MCHGCHGYICWLRSCACIHCWSTPMWPSCTTTKLFTIFVAGTWILSVLPTPIWTDWLPRLSVHWLLLSVPRKIQKALGRPCINPRLLNKQWLFHLVYIVLSTELPDPKYLYQSGYMGFLRNHTAHCFSMAWHTFQHGGLLAGLGVIEFLTLSTLVAMTSGFDGALNVDITELLERNCLD